VARNPPFLCTEHQNPVGRPNGVLLFGNERVGRRTSIAATLATGSVPTPAVSICSNSWTARLSLGSFHLGLAVELDRRPPCKYTLLGDGRCHRFRRHPGELAALPRDVIVGHRFVGLLRTERPFAYSQKALGP
jgi:hypothetical protein